MLSSNSKKIIESIKRSIIYIAPILFLVIVSLYFFFGNKQKYEFNVKVEFGMDIKDQLNKFEMNSFLYETYNYIPNIESLNIEYYRQNYIKDFTELIANKTKCLVTRELVSENLNTIYLLKCLATDVPADEIEKNVLESHTITNSKYIKLYNNAVIRVIDYIDEQKDPKRFYITNIGNYEMQYNIKDTFKDMILSTLFILIAVAFLIYFLCLLLLNIT